MLYRSRVNFCALYAARQYATKTSRIAPEPKQRKVSKPKLLLAHTWRDGVDDPTGWWMSEKLDGVRALWDPSVQGLVSRGGLVYDPPEWFKKYLPNDLYLDGELWAGRGRFSKTVSTVRRFQETTTKNNLKGKEAVDRDGTPRGEDPWQEITYQVFDTPTHPSQKFEERQAVLQAYLQGLEDQKSRHPLVLVQQTKCRSADHLQKYVDKIIQEGGEGAMLVKPDSEYVPKRSRTLLKVKRFTDAEAIVVGHEEGTGKNAGAVGSLVCRLAVGDGPTFKVGSGLSDAERHETPPPIGSVITFRTMEWTKQGMPRHPTFVGIRIDYDPDSSQK
ncbi:hypothetical protein DFS34DRAFT_451416 [Phlyctochytrium arcticum]|nr:hypothetical protein DFS34DRAFT_451416 [Phlyctochytrium arcticum]